jgi:hypothetical protein
VNHFADMSEATGLLACLFRASGGTRGKIPAAVVSAGFGVTRAGGVRGNAAGHPRKEAHA